MHVAVLDFMKRTPAARSLPEEMGLQVQDVETLGLFDGLLAIALLISGAAWLWASIAAPELDLPAPLKSVSGRSIAALIGMASVVAVLRSLLVSRWPFSKRDGSLI